MCEWILCFTTIHQFTFPPKGWRALRHQKRRNISSVWKSKEWPHDRFWRISQPSISKFGMRLWSRSLNFCSSLVGKHCSNSFQLQQTCSRWKKISDSACHMCSGSKPQTNKHLLSNCSNPLMLDQYLQRHNEILKLISSWIDLKKSTSQRLFIDLDSANSISLVFHDSVRPDLILAVDSVILVLELTVCHESNLQTSRAFKQNKYENIANFCRDSWRKVPVKLFTVEVSILGFISDLDKFTASACLPNLPSSLKYKLIHTVLNYSFNIYSNRNDQKFKKFNAVHDNNINQWFRIMFPNSCGH